MPDPEAFFTRWLRDCADALRPGRVLCLRARLAALATLPLARLTLPEEQARAARFVQPADRLRHLAGRALAHGVLQVAAGKTLAPCALNERGKPFFPGGAEFSISHARDWVWVAFCPDAPVGVDGEADNRRVGDCTRLLHPAEAAALRALPETERNAAFLRCWVRKEAVLKALGDGLARPLRSFAVDVGDTSRNWLRVMEPPPATWTTEDLPVPGALCSVAAPLAGLAVEVRLMPAPDPLPASSDSRTA